ncbi:MAG: cupin domain-containing protein [Bacteroidota bacterium]
MENIFEKGHVLAFAELADYSENGIVSKRVIDKKTGNITLFAFDREQRLSEHTAPFDAMVQVIEGEAEIIIDGKSNMVKAGEAIIMPAGIRHAVNAPVRFKMLLTMIKE